MLEAYFGSSAIHLIWHVIPWMFSWIFSSHVTHGRPCTVYMYLTCVRVGGGGGWQQFDNWGPSNLTFPPKTWNKCCWISLLFFSLQPVLLPSHFLRCVWKQPQYFRPRGVTIPIKFMRGNETCIFRKRSHNRPRKLRPKRDSKWETDSVANCRRNYQLRSEWGTNTHIPYIK